MSHTTLIALMGPAGAGKTTAAEMLARHHGFEPYALATPIKTMLEALLVSVDVDHAHLHETHLKQQPIPELHHVCARRLMTTLGDWGRSLHPQLWIHATQRALGLPHAPVAPRIVISDVRYPDEADWIRSMGGRVWLIERDTNQLSLVPAHSSETSHQAITPDVRISNRGTLDDLRAELDAEMRVVEAAEARAMELRA